MQDPKKLPNLDTMTADELAKFWAKYHLTNRQKAAELVGNRTDRVRIVERAAAYAIARKCSIDLREAGNVDQAMVYDRHCDLYFEELPKDVRW